MSEAVAWGSVAARELIRDLPASLTVSDAACRIIEAAGPSSELSRAIAVLGIQASDFCDWVDESEFGSGRVTRSRIASACIDAPEPWGYSTGTILRLLLDEASVFGQMAVEIRAAWGITDLDRDTALDAVRRTSIEAVRSAAIDPTETVPLPVSLKAWPETPGEDEVISIPTSLGLGSILDRAEANTKYLASNNITTACVLRAVLPTWGTPGLRQFIRGIGVGTEIATPHWIADSGEGTSRNRVVLGTSSRMFYVTDAAWQALYVGAVLRDIANVAMTCEQLIIGLLCVTSSCLSGLARDSIGPGVNLPLLFLRLDGGLSVTASEADIAVALGEISPALIHPLDDLPPSIIAALERDLASFGPEGRNTWSQVDRVRAATAAWRGARPMTNPDGEIDCDALRSRFAHAGNIAALRQALSFASAVDFSNSRRSADLVRGSVTALEPGDVDELRLESSTTLAKLARGEVADLSDPGAIEPTLGMKLALLASQDWSPSDMSVADSLWPSFRDITAAALAAKNYELAAVAAAVSARVRARIFRARMGLPPGVAGANPDLCAHDLQRAEDTVIVVHLAEGAAAVIRLGSPGTAIITPLSSEAVSAWWRRYRTACLAGNAVGTLLAELASLTGLDAVLSVASEAGPIRLCVSGDLSALPLGQAVASVLADRAVPVIAHLCGGPLEDRGGDALAPTGRTAGRVAIVPPPAVEEVSELPFAEQEAAALARLHGARFKLKPISGRRAVILRMMELASSADRPLAWHFAAHGTIRGTASGVPSAGILVADHEMISCFDIGRFANANVLFCSSCDIAVVPLAPGALSWPFAALAGGTRFVVAASAPVSDPLSLICMVKTHERWLTSGVPVWRALSDAQSWMDSATEEEVLRTLERHEVASGLAERAAAALAAQQARDDLGNQWSFATYAA